MTASDIRRAVELVIDALEELGVRHHVGGSVASSIVGIPRTTIDVDLVADLQPKHAAPLAKRLAKDYYIDEDAVRDAIRRRASFNAIHLATMMKVDVFVLKTRPFDRTSFERMRRDTLEDGDGARELWVSSPEDTILHKLEGYRIGSEISERQ